jgi:arsenite oxidase small subunit
LEYAKKKVGSLSALKSVGTMDFSYPDVDSPCQAVYIDGKVQAYSILCTHKGCPLMYNASNKTFVCPCHFSKFDAEKDGQMVIGQATSDLPQVFVKIEGDSIIAYGIDGLVFGRESNKLG